jgi:hypothetical protein
VKALERAGATAGVDVVAKGRSAGIDSRTENPLDLLGQAIRAARGQPIGATSGIDAGCKERLIGVNVPDPGDHRLVEQDRFDGPPRRTKRGTEMCRERVEGLADRVRPEIGPQPRF